MWRALKAVFTQARSFLLLFSVLGLVSSAAAAYDPEGLSGAAISLIIGLLTPVAVLKYGLHIAQSASTSLRSLFVTSVKEYLTVLMGYIAVITIYVVAALPLFIPLIWILPWFAFVLFIIVDEGISLGQACRRSKQLGGSHKGAIWSLILLSLLLSVVAAGSFAFPQVGWVISELVNIIVSLAAMIAFARLYLYCKAQVKETNKANS